MKLLIENWRSYLEEDDNPQEEIEEGAVSSTLAGLGLALGLGGTPDVPDMAEPEPTQQVDTQQQQAEVGAVDMDDNGNFKVTVATPDGLKGSMAWSVASSKAKSALMKHMAGMSDDPDNFVFAGDLSMRRISSTPDFMTHTYTGTITK
tara:strand:- start:876 stop:1319 length:444 start_codon:yes stop_codon:yes gene_type:complete